MTRLMAADYINRLLEKTEYSKDENGVILAKVPGYQGFFSQGDTYQEARENLADAIQGVIYYKLLDKDQKTIDDIKAFNQKNMLAYA